MQQSFIQLQLHIEFWVISVLLLSGLPGCIHPVDSPAEPVITYIDDTIPAVDPPDDTIPTVIPPKDTIIQKRTTGFAPFKTGTTWLYRISHYRYVSGDTLFRKITIINTDSTHAVLEIHDSACCLYGLFVYPGWPQPGEIFTDTVEIGFSDLTAASLIDSYFPRSGFPETSLDEISCGDDVWLWHHDSTGAYYSNQIISDYISGIGLVRQRTSNHGGGSHTELIEFNSQLVDFTTCL